MAVKFKDLQPDRLQQFVTVFHSTRGPAPHNAVVSSGPNTEIFRNFHAGTLLAAIQRSMIPNQDQDNRSSYTGTIHAYRISTSLIERAPAYDDAGFDKVRSNPLDPASIARFFARSWSY